MIWLYGVLNLKMILESFVYLALPFSKCKHVWMDIGNYWLYDFRSISLSFEVVYVIVPKSNFTMAKLGHHSPALSLSVTQSLKAARGCLSVGADCTPTRSQWLSIYVPQIQRCTKTDGFRFRFRISILTFVGRCCLFLGAAHALLAKGLIIYLLSRLFSWETSILSWAEIPWQPEALKAQKLQSSESRTKSRQRQRGWNVGFFGAWVGFTGWSVGCAGCRDCNLHLT